MERGIFYWVLFLHHQSQMIILLGLKFNRRIMTRRRRDWCYKSQKPIIIISCLIVELGSNKVSFHPSQNRYVDVYFKAISIRVFWVIFVLWDLKLVYFNIKVEWTYSAAPISNLTALGQRLKQVRKNELGHINSCIANLSHCQTLQQMLLASLPNHERRRSNQQKTRIVEVGNIAQAPKIF